MAANQRPLQFLDYLPEVFRADGGNNGSFVRNFLTAFEMLFEELQSEIEGAASDASGGIPDLFSPDTTPPPQFVHRPQADSEYLRYLASWIALPLRAEKPISFHRAFFQTAIPLYSKRGTLSGIDALLRAWLRGDIVGKARLILTDLTRVYNDVDTIMQLAPADSKDSQPDEVYAQLGVNTVLGEGPPFFFLVDLLTNPAVRELRHPAGLDAFQRAARFLLDAEKPAHTYYQLRVRAHTMQLAPAEPAPTEAGFPRPYAQIGVSTLLWEEPWVFDSEF